MVVGAQHYQLCNPGGGGGGGEVLGIYIGGGVAHKKRGVLGAGTAHGVLGAGIAPKRGVLGRGRYNQKNGGLSCVCNPKKGHL